jgi:hypothetical protein
MLFIWSQAAMQLISRKLAKDCLLAEQVAVFKTFRIKAEQLIFPV